VMAKLIDLNGRVFDRMTVLRRAHNIDNQAAWECICVCGNKTIVRGLSLRRGETRSCGCLCIELRTKHGLYKTVEYKAWRQMKSRVLNPNGEKYHRYGGRGITVCERWLHSPENFISDMGLRPSVDHSLDRVDNDGPYSPENCRWATRTEQMRNQSCSERNTSGTLGVSFYKNRWTACITANYKKIHLGRFLHIEDAVAARKDGEKVYW